MSTLVSRYEKIYGLNTSRKLSNVCTCSYLFTHKNWRFVGLLKISLFKQNILWLASFPKLWISIEVIVMLNRCHNCWGTTLCFYYIVFVFKNFFRSVRTRLFFSQSQWPFTSQNRRFWLTAIFRKQVEH